MGKSGIRLPPFKLGSFNFGVDVHPDESISLWNEPYLGIPIS